MCRDWLLTVEPTSALFKNIAHCVTIMDKGLSPCETSPYVPWRTTWEMSPRALFRLANRWAAEQYLQRKPMHALSDLVAAYKEGGKEKAASDPQGPLSYVATFEPGTFRPTLRKSFVCNFLKNTTGPNASTGGHPEQCLQRPCVF